MFKIIACINKKNAIGKEGSLLYNIKNDMTNFARQTKFNVVIMGRSTFESLPNKVPLIDRVNIVITSDDDYSIEEYPNSDVYIAHSIQDAVDLCSTLFYDKEWFVIGGGSIYKQFLDEGLVDEMRLTIVNDDSEGDTHFPEFDRDGWRTYYKSMAQTSTYGGVDNSFYFEVLKKK